ncbi:condensation domain-containing protein, partial [Tenacibaculum agarivorans]|uniref:condensation domain-containing protein n=1 Tax=Tenacibaculum agarivorans TaxID=1908389 RepID=UPI000AB7B99C
EVFPKGLYDSFISLGTSINLENLYGPTEATVYSSYFSTNELTTHSSIPIGKPLDNVELLVLDSYNRLLPLGVIGELCIGGSGLSQGYINRAELTSEKFIVHPFKEGERLYRTGDLARWLEDGNLEFLGRIDSQVKLRGFRIELGEIENQLLGYPSIRDVVVNVVEQNQDKHLVGYYVSETSIDSSELRSFLRGKLPEYMLPSYYVHLDALPITANGKVDRKNLPNPTLDIGDHYVSASNEIEETLVKIWSDVLAIEEDLISVERSFFELGGHSLKATVMMNLILRDLNTEVPLREVFHYNTIRSLSDFISRQSKQMYLGIEMGESLAYYPLSSVQRRLHFIYNLDKTSLVYNMPQTIGISSSITKDELEVVFEKLIERHDSFRTSFEFLKGEVVQRIHPEVDFSIEEYAGDDIDAVMSDFVRPFDLSKGPLLRAGLLRLPGEESILLIDMHHIIIDGVSLELVKTEFSDLLSGTELSLPRLQYKDYILWQQSSLYQSKLGVQREFWLSEYSDLPKVLELPLDHSRGSIRDYSGDSKVLRLSKESTESLRLLASNIGTTLYVPTLAILNILLSKLGNQEDIVVGTVVSGRDHADLKDIVGMFVNTLALRNNVDGSLSFMDFLASVKART